MVSNLLEEKKIDNNSTIMNISNVVPPRWTVEPADSSAAAGHEAVMHCQADGYPKPVVTWKKSVGK